MEFLAISQLKKEHREDESLYFRSVVAEVLRVADKDKNN